MSRNLRDEYFDRRYLEEEIDKAFLRGLKQGRIEGYDKGFDEGEFQGFNHGRKQGYDNGFNDGNNRGYDNGYDTGYDKCKQNFEDQVQQAYEDGNQAGYKKGYQEGYDNCEEEYNGSTIMFYTTTAQVSHANVSTETTDLTNFKSMTANAETMTEPTTISDSINIEYEPELLIPTVISDISFPQMQSIFATVSTDDFIPPVQKSPHLCASIDDQRSPFKGVLSAPSFSTTPTYAQYSDKYATKLAVINKTTSSDFFDEQSKPPNGHHSSDNLYSFASNIGTAARMRRNPDTFRGGG
jgi:hypothetical protein